jgi:glucan phosphoethanolaminetransferase (alkaline phosphatase superfamily)
MNNQDSQEINFKPKPRRKSSSFYEILFSLTIFIYTEYLLKNKVECTPSMNDWLSTLLSIFEVLLLCTIISRLDFGQTVHNIQKILKILAYLSFVFFCFYGLYKSLLDETCRTLWPMGFFSVVAISSIPILYFLTLSGMLIYLLSSEYSSKTN